MQNIGLSFVRLTHFADAIASFEYIASERGDLDAQTAFHLIVCYYAMGDSEKMKYYFGKLLQCKVEDQFEERYGHHEILTNGGNIFASADPGGTTGSVGGHHSPLVGMDRSTPSGEMTLTGRSSSPTLLIRDEHDHHSNLLIEAIRNDRLRQYEKEKIQQVEWCVLTAAKLIAPYIEQTATIANGSMINNMIGLNGENETNITNSGNIGAGYDWCLDQIRRMAHAAVANGLTNGNGRQSISGSTFPGGQSYALNYSNLADELELYKAVKHLRLREFDQAIGTLKTFERKDKLTSTISSSARISDLTGHIPLRSVASASASLSIGQPTQGGLAVTTPIVSSSSITPTHGTRFMSVSTSTTGNSRVAATAATNLSFLYLLQQELDIAARYADEAIGADRYCTGAMLNRGNVYFHKSDYQRAIELYREVINSNPNCLEAYYNLALAERRLNNHDKALESLFRLRTITKMPSNHQSILNQKISNTVEVNLLFQIGSM